VASPAERAWPGRAAPPVAFVVVAVLSLPVLHPVPSCLGCGDPPRYGHF